MTKTMKYHAEIVNISLKDKGMIQKYKILDIRKRYLGLVKIYTIAIPEEEIESALEEFQANLGTALKKEWYITFHTAQQAIVVFRKKIFRMSSKGIISVFQKPVDTTYAEDKQKWDEMIDYAKSLGVPADQCDFLPQDFIKQDYS